MIARWMAPPALLVFAACGLAQPVASTSPSPARSPILPAPVASASPSPTGANPHLLFAALEALGTDTAYDWNTVAVAGLDGFARAKTTFTPMPPPFVGCRLGPLYPPSAYAAAGRVFFADGSGAVRSLSPGGQIVSVTSFPLRSGQMLSFAVSPDGARLLATLITFPPPPQPCAASAFAPGDFGYDVYAATAGSASRLLYHKTVPQPGPNASAWPNLMQLWGWDSIGPIGTDPSYVGSQGGGPQHYFGVPVRVDARTGTVQQQIADPQTCLVWDVAKNGDFVCTDQAGNISVLHPDGTPAWRFARQPPNEYIDAFLSPDETHVVALNLGTEIVGRDGSRVLMPTDWIHQGWLDAQTVIGGGYERNFSYVSLTDPHTIVDIGFKGLFVGTVQS